MNLKCGIVGLPNVGKSTLFNALSSTKADVANYPFCTIEPNTGVINVPDARLEKIAAIYNPQRIVPATIEFIDIAGLVKGAHKGEGLGNKFLSHIRDVHAVIHLVRSFLSEEVVHVDGTVDPERDIEVINTELVLADLQSIEKRIEKEKIAAKSGKRELQEKVKWLEQLREHLNQGHPARTYSDWENANLEGQSLFLLTSKPVLFVANGSGKAEEAPLVDKIQANADKEGGKVLSLDCSLEAEIAELSVEEKAQYVEELGLEEAGLGKLIHAAFDLLGLITFYSVGSKEVRAWTIPKGNKAPQAAGAIHSDFERGFIRAEIYHADELIRLGSEAKMREAGLMRQEGRDYVVQPDDIIYFRFNV